MSKLTPTAVLHGTIAIASGGGGGEDTLYQMMSGDTISYSYDNASDSVCHGMYAKITALTLGEHITSIDDDAFNKTDILESLTANSVTDVGDFAFMGCSNLTSISLPACQVIGMNAFWGTSLSDITLPVCSEIKDNAFYDCIDLEHVRLGYSGVVDVSDGVSTFSGCSSALTIHVPADYLTAYQADASWQAIVQEIETAGGTLTIAGDYA